MGGVKMANFEKDIECLFKEDIKNSDDFCVELWSALANVEWTNKDGSDVKCSFRYAGEIIADIRGSGRYMDWYCGREYAIVSNRISSEMDKLGWTYKTDE